MKIALVQHISVHRNESGMTISVSMMGTCFHNEGLYARHPMYVSLLINDTEQYCVRSRWPREHVSLIRQQLGSLLFTDVSWFVLKTDSGCVVIWREQSIRYTTIATSLKDTVIEKVVS